MIKHNSLHLGGKYAQIFLLGLYLFGISVQQLIFDCRSYCGLSHRMQGSCLLCRFSELIEKHSKPSSKQQFETIQSTACSSDWTSSKRIPAMYSMHSFEESQNVQVPIHLQRLHFFSRCTEGSL